MVGEDSSSSIAAGMHPQRLGFSIVAKALIRVKKAEKREDQSLCRVSASLVHITVPGPFWINDQRFVVVGEDAADRGYKLAASPRWCQRRGRGRSHLTQHSSSAIHFREEDRRRILLALLEKTIKSYGVSLTSLICKKDPLFYFIFSFQESK